MKRLMQAALILFSFAHAHGAKVVNRTIATVNGEAILQSEFEKNWEAFSEQQKTLLPPEQVTPQWREETRRKILEQMIDDKVLLQEAKKQKVRVNKRDLENGVQQVKVRFLPQEARQALQDLLRKQAEAAGDDPEASADLGAAWRDLSQSNAAAVKEAEVKFQQELDKEGLTYKKFEERISDQISVVQLTQQAVRERAPQPSDEQAKALYDRLLLIMQGKPVKGISEEEAQDLESMSKFFAAQTGERVHARHILIQVPQGASFKDKSQALRQIKELRDQIKKGASFAELAKKNSDDKASAVRGGDLGFFNRGQMVPTFEDAAFGLEVGQVSDVVESDFGYHLIKVEEKHTASKLRYEDVNEELKEYLFRGQAQKVFEGYVKDLRKGASVKINDTAQLGQN